MKLTKRKGFNFFRSYYDVYNELNDKEKVKFMDALLDRQFLGVKPDDLKGMAKFAYISQTNSIDSQVKGYEDKTGVQLLAPTEPPCQGVDETIPTPTEQVEGEVQVQVKGEEEEEEKKGEILNNIIYPFDSEEFFKFWKMWKDYKLKSFDFKYKTEVSEQAALKKLATLSGINETIAIEIIEQSLANGWKGFFKIDKNGTSDKQTREQAFKNF